MKKNSRFDDSKQLKNKGAVNEVREKNVLENTVFLLKSLVLRSERAKPVFKNVQKHLYDPKHVLLCIIFLHARKLHWS